MYLLEELLLADLLEKIIRLEIYLNDVLLHASEDEIKIIEFYKNILKIIRNQLEDSTDLLRKYHGGKFSNKTSNTFIKSIQRPALLNSCMRITYSNQDFVRVLEPFRFVLMTDPSQKNSPYL